MKNPGPKSAIISITGRTKSNSSAETISHTIARHIITQNPAGKQVSMIDRDGHTISLWQESADKYVTQNAPDGNSQFDVAIVGGGITGVTTALLSQKAGKRCILFEAYNLCYGTTGGTTAHLNTLLDNPYSTIIKDFGKENAQLVARACKRAIDLVRSNINQYDIDCGFENTSAYLFAQTEKQVKERSEERRVGKEC